MYHRGEPMVAINGKLVTDMEFGRHSGRCGMSLRFDWRG